MTKAKSCRSSHLENFRVSQAFIKKVMLGASRPPVHFISKCKGEPVIRDHLQQLSFDLFQATQARPIYEQALQLPLEDLFYVGGQLQTLIRRAESVLDAACGGYLSEEPCASIQSQIEDVKSFRRYIVRRICSGS